MAVAEREIEVDVDPLDIDQVIADRVASGDIVVPPFPRVLAAVNAAVAGGASMNEIAALVGADPALAAALLRVVNTPMFSGIGGPVVSLQNAVQRLGLKRLQRMAMGSILASSALSRGPLFELRRRVWRECVASSLVAEAVANGNGVPVDVAHLAALMHDFGKIIAIGCIEDSLGDESDPMAAEPYWLHVVERHHCDLGAYLAEAWGLPEPIPAVIAGHHQTLGSGRVALLDVIHVCDAVAAALGDLGELSLDDLAAVPGVRSREEAALVARSLDRMPQLLSALGDAPPAPPRPPQAPKSSAPASTFLSSPTLVNVPTCILGHGRVSGLTTIAVGRDGLAVVSPEALPEGWVTHLELEGPRGPFRIWVTVLSSRRHAPELHIAEAKPLSLRGAVAEAWTTFVDDLRVTHPAA